MREVSKDTVKWIVYKLVNRTLKEIYFGMCRRPIHSLHDHQKANIPVTDHWDFQRHDIEHHVVYTGLTESQAIVKAQELAKLPHLDEFKVINSFAVHMWRAS